ncbi:MAG: prephenate dehydrogenase [Chloroflexota bacterium]|nr:prephenate dehydrogenase [Chloroflexota bacterium]
MKIAIVGGYGQMGRWLARFLLKDGKEVTLIGRNERKLAQASTELGGVAATTDVSAVKNADVILLSVSMDSFEEVVKQIARHTHTGQYIIDITSIKASPVEAMHKHVKKGVVLGTHPMFGPGARSLKGQNVVLTPTNPAEDSLAQKVKNYLEAKGAIVTSMSPREHDETMAITLGLSHFIAMVSADTLLSLDKLEQSRKIAGTTFKVLLTLIEGVVSHEPAFYANLQTSLDVDGIEQLFQENARTWAELIKNKDKAEMVRRVKLVRERLEKDNPDFGKAYDDMYQMIDGK